MILTFLLVKWVFAVPSGKSYLPYRDFYRLPTKSSIGPTATDWKYGILLKDWTNFDLYGSTDEPKSIDEPRSIDLLTRGFKKPWPKFEKGQVPENLSYQVTDRSKAVLGDPRGSTMNYTPKWNPKPIETFAGKVTKGDLDVSSYNRYYISKLLKDAQKNNKEEYREWSKADGFIPNLSEFIRKTNILFLNPNASRDGVIKTLDNWTDAMTDGLAAYAVYANIVDPRVFSSDGRCIDRTVCGDFTYTEGMDSGHPAALQRFGWLREYYKRMANAQYRSIAAYHETRRNLAKNRKDEDIKYIEPSKSNKVPLHLQEQNDSIKKYISECKTSQCRNLMESNRLTIDDLHELRKALPAMAGRLAEEKFSGYFPKRSTKTNKLNPALEDPLNVRRSYAPNLLYIRGLDGNAEVQKYSDRYFQQKVKNRKGAEPELQSSAALQRERYWKAEHNRYLSRQQGITGTRATWNDLRGNCLWQDYKRTTGYRYKGYIMGNNRLNVPLRSKFKGK